ncbi:MAG: hypothetical protein KC609_22355 [Myxococcales bacterium]|nr:hypothetical protein [Myxococcales bacterium]
MQHRFEKVAAHLGLERTLAALADVGARLPEYDDSQHGQGYQALADDFGRQLGRDRRMLAALRLLTQYPYAEDALHWLRADLSVARRTVERELIEADSLSHGIFPVTVEQALDERHSAPVPLERIFPASLGEPSPVIIEQIETQYVGLTEAMLEARRRELEAVWSESEAQTDFAKAMVWSGGADRATEAFERLLEAARQQSADPGVDASLFGRCGDDDQRLTMVAEVLENRDRLFSHIGILCMLAGLPSWGLSYLASALVTNHESLEALTAAAEHFIDDEEHLAPVLSQLESGERGARNWAAVFRFRRQAHDGDPTATRSGYRQLCELIGDDAHLARVALARCRLLEGDYSGCREAIEEAEGIRERWSYADRLWVDGRLLEQRGDPALAFDAFDEALGRRFSDPRLWTRAAGLVARSPRLAPAFEERLLLAVQRAPNWRLLWELLAGHTRHEALARALRADLAERPSRHAPAS